MNHHIIYKQKAIITVAKQSDAYSLQNEISDVIKNELPQLLQDVFDSISPNDDIIRIESLQVDLGALPAQNTGQAFKLKVVEKIREAITVNKQDKITENGVSLIHKQQSLREAFLYFLQYGSKPWYIGDKKKEGLENEMLQHFTNDDWNKIVVWLKQNYWQQPVLIERLVYQFSNDFLHELINHIISFGKEKWHFIYDDLVAIFTWLRASNNAVIRDEVFTHCFTIFLQQAQLPEALHEVIKTKFLSAVYDNHFVVQPQLTIAENIATDIIRETFVRLAEEVSQQQKGLKKLQQINEVSGINVLSESDDKNQPQKNKLPANFFEREPQYVSNSSIVLLHPFLQMYFAELGLLQQKKFISSEAQKRAVLLLHYLATGETEVEEWNLLLQKLMCGLSFDETLPNHIELTEKEKEESDRLLQSVINYCTPLKNTSLAGLRSTFLQRDGRLEKKENGWLLTVEQKTVDVLLDKLPWGFSAIKFPWLTDMINVDWC